MLARRVRACEGGPDELPLSGLHRRLVHVLADNLRLRKQYNLLYLNVLAQQEREEEEEEEEENDDEEEGDGEGAEGRRDSTAAGDGDEDNEA